MMRRLLNGLQCFLQVVGAPWGIGCELRARVILGLVVNSLVMGCGVVPQFGDSSIDRDGQKDPRASLVYLVHYSGSQRTP